MLIGLVDVDTVLRHLDHPGLQRLVYTARIVLGGAFRFDVGRYGRAPEWVNLVLGTFGAVALFMALYVLLRSQRMIASLDVDEERAVRRLLALHGEAVQ